MKKKKLKTLLTIGIIALLVIAGIVLAILLRKDAHGYNTLQRKQVVASAGGESITLGEYVLGLDNALNYYSTYYGMTYDESNIKELQDTVIDQQLKSKIAIKKVDELGLSFTAEELAHFKEAAKEQLESLEESIGKQMSSSGSFSNASLQSQINEYFTRQLGMSKNEYLKYVEEQEKAEHAQEKLQEYYKSDIENYTEDDLKTYYRDYVLDNYAANYTEGTYSMQQYMYMIGYSSTPFLYVPEGFICIDTVSYTASTEEEVNALKKQLDDGASFEDIANMAGVTTLYDTLKGPYPIAENEWGYVLGSADAYNLAKELEVGETGSVIVPATAAEGETPSSYTLYVVKRTGFDMCPDGADYGVVDIDYYDGVRSSVKSAYETQNFYDIEQAWLTEKNVSEAAYKYTGL